MLTLDILICTINEGILGITNMLLAPIQGVRYVVSWQQCGYSAETPQELLQRSDVTVTTLAERGLSRNRNNAIAHSTADICLVADDDVRYRREYFDTVIRTFSEHPEIDIATFKYHSTSEYKVYPSHSFNLRNTPKGYYVSSIEIAFRRKSVAGTLRFNELFGLGAPVLHAGEEGIFILDALHQGLQCRYFPETIAEHNHPTTSTTKIATPGVLMANGAYIRMAYRDGSAPLRYVLKAWRVHRQFPTISFFTALRHIINGSTYISKHCRH